MLRRIGEVRQLLLKSIEIQGFKSFPDKTLLTFSEGITAVVGPNGSGKSNIADAIRWVLGEQSAKTLRGGRMEDVIFGGTRRRSPMGFCEVSITIDNSDRSMPVEYDEVTVTRRYYRSGENEFFVNKRGVRLKDVREMFMDTGLGRDGYSMIGQGRIDEVLSVKSADRREIFEEAAGISKVRLRKEESRRKLEQAEENLVRVRDIITEMETRVGPLQKQAEKARKFLLLRDELRVLEVSAAVDSLDRLEEQIKTATVDFDNAERMLSARKGELERFYSESEAFTEKAAQLDSALEEARRTLDEVKQQISDNESQEAVNRANLKNAEENLALHKSEAVDRQRRGDEIEAQVKDNEGRRADIESKLAQRRQELDDLTHEIEEAGKHARDIVEKAEALRAASALHKDNRQAKLAGIMSLKAAMSQMEERREAGFWQRNDSADKLKRQQELLAQLDEQLSAQDEKRQSAQNSLNGVEMMINLRRDKLEKNQAALLEAEREINASADRLTMLKNMEREYEGFNQSVRKIMQAGRGLSGVHGPLSSLIRTGDRYSTAVETALGAAMQNIVVDNEECAKAAIGYLKSNNFGRATFLPVTSIKPRWSSRRDLNGERGFCGYGDGLVECESTYKDIVSSLLGTTAVVDNIDSAIAMGRKYKYSFRIVTLDGQLISSGGAMTGGSTVRSTGVLTRANEIQRLEGLVSEKKAALEELKAARDKAAQDAQAAEYQRKAAEDEVRQAGEAIAELNARISRESAIAEGLQETIASLDEEKAGYERRRAENEAEIDKLQAEADELEIKAKEAEEQANELSKDAEDGSAGKLESRLTAVRLDISALEAEGAALADSHAMLERMLAEAREEMSGKLTVAEKAEGEIEALKAAIEKNAADRAELSEKRDGLAAEIDKLTGRRLSLDGEKTRLEREIQNKNNEIIIQERERSRLENRCQSLESENTAILDRLWEAYELTRATARDIYQKPDDEQAASARIAELKGAIKALGSVNIDSIEEFEEVNARYTFMTGQRDDLEKAKADLTEVIDRLTSNMEESFLNSFREINRSFSETFSEIFGGGSAYLKLEDEKNILECGIDISVELPGKGVRAISLLSGGEKAFVATALYFAIIKVSPTPFCVMDEIDAALDEVNVARFAEYMRKLCAHTQFIVITHRRGTMEGSDILYGATMQEHGVTKLLKLDIREVESRLNIKLS